MTVSVRSYLTVGVAALAASAVAVAPVHAPAQQSVGTAAVRISAAVQPLLQRVGTAAAVLGLVSASAPTTPKPAAASAGATPQASATANATGDWVANAWNFADYWISYGADLTQYVLGWVWPLSLIGDQAPILWYNLGSPIGDATVYGLIIPVLNDPLNWSVWSAGLTTVAQTTVTALVNTGVAEFNYFLGWLIPPLPPLPFPPLPIAAVPAKAGPAAAAALTAEVTAPTASPRTANPAHALRTPLVAAVEDAGAPATDAVEGTKKMVVDPTDVKADPQDQVKANATDTATPDVTSGGQEPVKDTGNSARDNTKKVRSAAGSSRDHSAKNRTHDSGE
jgi:hypothetical protein